MPNNMKLEEGMNVLDVDEWGCMHVWVRDGSVYEITVFNAKKSRLTTIGSGSRPCDKIIKLFVDTGWDV